MTLQFQSVVRFIFKCSILYVNEYVKNEIMINVTDVLQIFNIAVLKDCDF